MALPCPGEESLVTADKSAPAIRKCGLPVMASAWISPALARSAWVSSAARSSISPLGPSVVGLRWSSPLSKVSRASTLPLGRATSETSEWVTVSSCMSSAMAEKSCEVVAVMVLLL